MTRSAQTLRPGDLVHVRSRHYLVEGIKEGKTPDESTLLELSCLDDDAQGMPLTVLWEREVDARRLDQVDWQVVTRRGFDSPELFSAYMHTLRWNCVTATDAKLFQSPYRAGIQVKAYQLEPLRMALAMPRVKLFIADDVGLGKTIEAGLILREMLMRQKVRQCVIAAPPSVVRQWKEEMEERFGLTFIIYDRAFVTRIRQERGHAINPFTTHTRFIISHALLRDERYASSLRDWLGEFATKSMLILDEAHHAAPSSGSKYARDSQLTRVMRELSPRFEHKIFLSATPHNGHSNSFSSLLELLDPQRFCRGVPVESSLRDNVMVRRLKSDLSAIGEDFPRREILRLAIDDLPESAPELLLSEKLSAYRKLREARHKAATKSQQKSSMLVLTSLQKRLLSSIEAFHRTLLVHRKSITAQIDRAEATHQTRYDTSLLEDGVDADSPFATLDEDEVIAEEQAQMERASRTLLAPSQSELDLLDAMIAIAHDARHDADPRIRYLEEWLREHMCPDLGKKDAAWLPRRVLIFTEYADTKRYLVEQLGALIARSDQAAARIDAFHGGIGEERREALKAAFNKDPASHPLRILIATDAAREGVNLQNNCSDLFHFDIPWNPGRLEQRNGRLDRKLQRAPVVSCRYFVLPQRAEDRVLEVLVHKTQVIQEELGSLSPVVARRIEEVFRRGIAHEHIEDITLALNSPEWSFSDPPHDDLLTDEHFTVKTIKIEMGHELAEQRKHKLQQNVETLRELLDKSRAFIGLDETHLRDALSASLHTLGAPPLEPVDAKQAARDISHAQFAMPALDQRYSQDASWAHTLDALRRPRQPTQTLAEWRNLEPVRPVVFEDTGTLDGDSVHLHLEHRVVKRLLSRFLSKGFKEDILRRACVIRTDEALPKVVLLGRLSLFGELGARHHDELLAVAAHWSPPSQRTTRDGGLSLLNLGDRDLVLDELEEALKHPHLREVKEGVRALLAEHAQRDVTSLLAGLERRAGVIDERAHRALQKRGEVEAHAMIDILEAQRKRIRAQQEKVLARSTQLTLGFDADEKRQLELDEKHWRRRLDEIELELETEPRSIRDHYIVRARRLEPVGLVYLWPLSS